jgi:hypothetical protein
MKLKPRHKRELEHIGRKTQRYIDHLRVYPRANVMLDKVVMAHVSKALNVARGVVCLLNCGLPEEAFAQSRTLVEVGFNLRFITNKDSERRARRFVDYFAVWKAEQIRRALKHFKSDKKDQLGIPLPKYTKAQLQREAPNYAFFARRARKFPNPGSWTQASKKKRGSVWKMAMEPDKHGERDLLGAPATWEFDYDWIYFWTSQYVHATVVSMDSHAVLPTQVFKVYVAPQLGEHTAGLAIFNTALYLSKILAMAFRAIGHDFPSDLSTPLGDLLHELASDEPKFKTSKQTSRN